MPAVTSFDVLIRGARVVDGTGNPWRYGDVAISGDRIAAVEPPDTIPAEQAARVVDAAGMVVAPGFIDIQSHSIYPLMVDPACLSKITQGVTTEIMGEARTPAPFGGRRGRPIEGVMAASVQSSLAEWEERARGWRRFRDWLEAFVARGVSPNVGSFVGGGTVREYARGMDAGPSSRDEIELMKRVAHEAMADGALGVAYALIYPPDCFADTDEIVAVSEAVAEHRGLYVTHMRSEGDQILPALEETFEIGRRSGAAVEIYHLKAAGHENWPKMAEVVRRIERARADGLDVTADMYPYPGAGTGLASVLPPWVAEGGRFYERLRDPAERRHIKAAVLDPASDWEPLGLHAGPEGVMPLTFLKPENKPYAGRRLAEIAAERGQDWVDCAMDLLADEGQRIFTVYFLMSEDNVRSQLRLPWIKVSTDAGGVDPAWAAAGGPTHPRAYGTYTRVLGKYVREEKALGIEDAVRKMSSAVADRLGLKERGLLRAGHYADVVVFDPATVADRATFQDPHQLSLGVRDVWVNGTAVLENGRHTSATPGRYLAGAG